MPVRKIEEIPVNDRPRNYPTLLVGVLCLNFGILFFDRNALNFLMPFVLPDLGLTNTQAGNIASVFSLTWAIAGIVVGGLSDRTGMRKPILIFVTLVFAICSLLSGVVTSFVMLFAVRLLMGVAEGGVLPISQALTVLEVSPERRGFAMGFMQNFGSNLLGSTAASLILVPFAVHFGWRHAFYLAAIPGVLSALLIWWFVREPPREAKVAGAPAQHLSLGEAFAQRNIVLCVLISILLVSHLVIAFVFLPLFLTKVRGYSPETMSWLIGALGVSAAISGFAAPGISDRVGRKPTMIVVIFMGVILPLAALFFEGSVWALGAIFFVGWTLVGAFPLFMATIPSETVDSRHTATALGLIMGVGEGVGGAISPTLAGMAADRFGLQAIVWIMLCLPIVAGLLSMGLRETAPRRLAALREVVAASAN
jgi:MFS transporter, ACS family, hexuronate transporter